MAGPISDIYSRKYSISGWCVIFIIGVAIQTAGNSNVATIYAGRWFAGMGVGALSMLVPMYNAELAPPGIRGSLVALQQLAITFGILVSYWIAYGTNCMFHSTDRIQNSLTTRYRGCYFHLYQYRDRRRFRSEYRGMASTSRYSNCPRDLATRRRHLPSILPSMVDASR